MTPLIALVLAALVLAGLLALALGRRQRGAGAHVAGHDPDAARDALTREVRSLADALADVEAPAERPVTAPATPRPDGPAPATGSQDADHPPAVDVAPPSLAAAYAALSARLLEEARCTESALARWAADLHLLAPVIADHEDDVVRALGPDALPDRRSAARVPVATDAVGRARYRVGVATAPTLRAAAPVLPTLPDRTSLPPRPVAPAPVQHEPTDVLRERARVGTARARVLVDDDPVTARRLAWEADLAAFDAVLLDAAHRGGDARLVSVRLRRQLALHLLAAERDPEVLATTRPGDVAPAVERVRAQLRACLEPHEQDALTTTLGSWTEGDEAASVEPVGPPGAAGASGVPGAVPA